MSCSNSTEEDLADIIVGRWQLTSIQTTDQEFINDCKSKDSILVNSNKTFTVTSHYEDDNCSIQQSSGTWYLESK